MELHGSMARPEASGEVSLSRCDLSVRAMHICHGLDCHTIGQLSDVIARKGAEFVLGRPNCGRKTLAELLDVVRVFRTRVPSYVPGPVTNETTNVSKGAEFTAEGSLASLEALEIPYGFPIEFVKLPVRIRNWCDKNRWETLGEFLRHAGAMSFGELTQVDNIGRRSANEVIELFRALETPEASTLRKFLPIASDSISLSLTEALRDLVACLDTRDFRLLEMRLVEKVTLDAAARTIGRTRALVGQVQDRFLDELNRLLTWFSDERVHLWQTWELTDDLVPALSARGVVQNTQLLASAISRVFKNSGEGDLLEQRWEDTFKSWGRELMGNEIFNSSRVNVREFASERGIPYLACRFQSWLNKHFGEVLLCDGACVARLERKLTAKQRALLHGDEVSDTRWAQSYNRLMQYRAEHGGADVPSGWKVNRKLAAWVSAQRQRRKKGVMPDEQIRLLEEVGFTWQIRERGSWEDRLAEVVDFRRAHGHCNIPLSCPENPRLGRFINAMRTQRNSGRLSVERIAKLDALGFPWGSTRVADASLGEDTVSAPWKARFDELVTYKEKYGNCEVPAKWNQNQQLANWVSMQRQRHKRGELPAVCAESLEKIGFTWRADHGKQSWQMRYAELLTFKETHGRCDVSVNDSENPSLGVWVANQRVNRRRGKLSSDQERLLAEAGFVWQAGPAQKSWETRYAELLAFRDAHGHCDVSSRSTDNRSLGLWVANQRTNRRLGRLTDEQIRLLTEVGFAWQKRSRVS